LPAKLAGVDPFVQFNVTFWKDGKTFAVLVTIVEVDNTSATYKFEIFTFSTFAVSWKL
jgi:glucan biosynthesis protein